MATTAQAWHLGYGEYDNGCGWAWYLMPCQPDGSPDYGKAVAVHDDGGHLMLPAPASQPAPTVDLRLVKAADLASSAGYIRHLPDGRFWVRSQSTHLAIGYFINPAVTECTCPDFQKRQPVGGCKHMRAARMHQAAQTAKVAA